MGRTAFTLWAIFLAGACSSPESNAPDGGQDGATDAPGGGPGGCPPQTPANGSSCSSDSLSCDYGTICQGVGAVCAAGAWTVAPYDNTNRCPDTAPADKSTCSECMPDTTVCAFNAACEADAGPSAKASCKSRSWSVTPLACDAGADDGGDAGDGGDGGAGDAASGG